MTSAYRNPAKEGSGNSRHVHGDAADLNTSHDDFTWQALFNALHTGLADSLLNGLNYCVKPRDKNTPFPRDAASSNSQVHVDWRPAHARRAGYNKRGQCPRRSAASWLLWVRLALFKHNFDRKLLTA